MKRQRLLVAVFASMTLAGWSGDTEIIMESYPDGYNSQGFTQPQGKWSESATKSKVAGLKATKSVFNSADADPATARFTPQIPVAGKYEVFITYPSQGNASDVKYTVVSADGTKEITLTQNGRQEGHVPPANDWHSLGVFTFNAGSGGYVEISDPLTGAKPLANEPNARIYADAVKFVPQGITLPADYVNTVGGSSSPATTVAESSPLPTLPAVTAPSGGLPELPTGTPVTVAAATTPATTPAATAGVAALPNLPAPATTTPAAGTVSALPTLPGAAATPGATLPDLPGAAAPAPGLPSLPTATADAASGLPALPAATADAGAGLPALPAATAGAAAGLPALPAATPAADAAAALPGLPAAPTPATPDAGLPDLPAATTAAVAQATPIPTPDLPSLAPVTPTPQRSAPSPSDTPVGGAPTGLPGGALSNLPPMPGPGMPPLPTGPVPAPVLASPSTAAFSPSAPAGLPPVPGAAPAPAAATASPRPESMSITQYNPSNLQWMYDFGAALNTARAQNKKVMIFFTAVGNQTSQVYETQYFMDPSVRQALNNYVLVKVDFPKNTRLGYSLGIFGAGIIVVTDGTGNVTSRIEQIPATPMDLIRLMAQAKLPSASPTPGATTGATGATTATGSTTAPAAPAAMPPVPGAPATPTLPGQAPAAPALPSLPGQAPVAPTPVV